MPKWSERFSAGEYERMDGTRVVRVFYHYRCKGWMAAAEWDKTLHTDILPNKKSAIEQADMMLDEACDKVGGY